VNAGKHVVRYYVNPQGKAVVRDWLHELASVQTRARIRIRLDRLEDGNLGDHRAVGGGVVELRLHFGPGYRVYVGIDGPRLVLLLCAGDMKRQGRDIRMAKTYWNEYKGRR